MHMWQINQQFAVPGVPWPDHGCGTALWLPTVTCQLIVGLLKMIIFQRPRHNSSTLSGLYGSQVNVPRILLVVVNSHFASIPYGAVLKALQTSDGALQDSAVGHS